MMMIFSFVNNIFYFIAFLGKMLFTKKKTLYQKKSFRLKIKVFEVKCHFLIKAKTKKKKKNHKK